MLILDTWKDEDKKENNIYLMKRKAIYLGSIVFSMLFWIMTFNSCCHASNEEITNILYAEQSDSKAVNSLLNTYYLSKKKSETLEQSLKRQSSAYHSKSKQYMKARLGFLSSYERKVYKRILNQVVLFKPNTSWQYTKHESITFYYSYNDMIVNLKRKWGNKVDFQTAKLIQGQYYFKTKKG